MEENENDRLIYDGTRCPHGEDMFLIHEEPATVKNKGYRYYGCTDCCTRKVVPGKEMDE